MSAPLVLFWHRRDLRLTDNVGLAAARQRSSQVVGCFCLDPNILQRDDVAAVRVTYMLGCLQTLQQAYLQAGSQLLILQGEPIQAIPKLVNALGAQAVFWNLDGEPYAKERDRLVQLALQQLGIEVNTYWDQLLHEPGKICTGNGAPYTVYTPFWKNWIQQPKAKPVGDERPLKGLSNTALEAAQQAGCMALPTAQALGFSWEGSLILEPGEQPALERLEEFCTQGLTNYQEQRDFPANPGTSGLSPALKFGTIGIRTIWAATLVGWEQSRSQEAQDGIQTWQKELAWREFYQHVLYFFPELAAGPYRPAWRNFPWDNNPDHFQAWCDGKTGYPIVDAAMRQLNETGWMHNRCRMIVASFLTKDLIIDWRWGEQYFMQRLIDGDLASNNGGWQWSASSGMDPKPLRIFNPKSQSQKFDPEGEYIRQWLPELRSLETEELVTGKIAPLERERCGYPAPIVDHHRQQEIFKQRYQQQKAGIETR